MSDWPQNTALAKTVWDLGFQYDPAKNIIVSRMQAWQRQVGFCWAYDVLCPAMMMVIDCEPIYFKYGGKDWMIELWKGQYGIETGGEIGVYRTALSPPSPPAIISSLSGWFPSITRAATGVKRSAEFFGCASDRELPTLSYTLTRNGSKLFDRGPEPHWWLTGFKWGVFTAKTSDLVMDLQITFKETGMLSAFCGGLEELKYPTASKGNSIEVKFDRPRTPQPWTPAETQHTQDANAVLVQQYIAVQGQLGLLTNDPEHSNDPNRFDESKLKSSREYQAIMGFFDSLAKGRDAMRKIWNEV